MAILSSLFTGSFQTTGSFGEVFVSGSVSASEYTGVFKGALSSSAQISDDISGSFTAPSASISTRLTSVEGNVGGQGVNSSDSPTFAGLTTTGDVTVQGKLTAQELIVSSSVTTMSIAQASGSTIFGDGISDTHQFTGSILIGSGSISGSHESTGSFGKLVVDSDISASSYRGTFIGALSSSEQISDNISGSWKGELSSSVYLQQVKSTISGSLSNSAIAALGGGHVSASVLSSGEQGTITLTTNGVAVNVDSGLQVGDSPTFTTTTLSGLDNNKLVRTDGSNVIGSADIADFISGTSNQITATNESNGTVTLSTPQDLHTSAKPIFGGLTSTGDVTVQGKLTAQELVVSSSVTTMSVAQASGSTVFGDDNSDTHHFTGSVFVTGSLNITHTGSFGRIEATTISSSTLNVDANSITIGGQTINEADAQVLNNTSGTNTGDVTLGGSGGYITISNQVITVDQIDISDDTNLTASTGITLDGDTISTNDSQIVHDSLSGFEANEHIDHSTVSITAGNGLTGGGDITTDRTIDVVGGTGITANADNIAIDFGDSTFNTNVSGSWKGELSGSHITLVGGGVSGSSVSSASFGELFISGSTRIGENLTVDGTLTAQEFVTEYLTETVIDVSGSTSFGNTVDDIHQFTGSILIGSGSISGSIKSTGSFGKLFGDGSDITNLPAAAINVYNNSGDNRIITSVDSNTVQGESGLTFDGNGLNISGHVTASGNTSGSVTSTGSFGQIDTDTLVGIGGNVKYKAGTQTFENAAGSKTMAVFRSANSVDLHYNNSKKFETTDTGVNITGAITASSIDIDSIQGNWTNAGNTVADLGTVTTVDINGGTIDGTTIATSDITIGGGDTLDVSAGTLTLANDQISGDKVEGGTIAATTITSLSSTSVTSTHVTASGNISGSATSTGSFGDAKVGPYIKLEGATGDVWAGTYNSTSGKAMLTKSGTQVRIGEVEAESSAHPLHIYSAGSSIANFASGDGGTLTLGSTLIKGNDGSYFPNAVGFGAVPEGSYTVDIGGTPLLGFKRSGTRVGYIQTTNTNDLDISTNNSGYKLRLNVFNNGEIHTGTGKVVLGGDISGSLTSTGSFGTLVSDSPYGSLLVGTKTKQSGFDNQLLIESPSPALLLKDNTGGNQATQFYTIYSANGIINHYFDHEKSIEFAHTTDIIGNNENIMLKIDANNVEFPYANTKISGSVTSTGSFGMLQTADDTHLGTKNYAISGSKISTGSFGRLQASFIGGNSAVVFDADNIQIDSSGNITPTAGADFSGSATSTISAGDYRSLNNTLYVDGSSKYVGIGTNAYTGVNEPGAFFFDVASTDGFAKIAVNGSNAALWLNNVGSGELIKGYDNTTLTFTLGQDGSIVSSAGATIGGLIQGVGVQVTNTGGPELKNATPTATNPTIVPSRGDANTGIGYGGANGSTADNINLITGGTTGLYIDSSQNVIIPVGIGIGETTLDHKLDIHGTGTGTSAAAIKLSGDDGSQHWAAIKFADSNTDKWALVSDVAANDSHNIAFYNYATNATSLIIDGSNENVGIGTSSPNTRLHVYQGTVSEKLAVFQSVGSGHTQGIVIGSGTDGTDGQGLHIGYGQQIDSGYFDAYDWDAGAYQTLKLNNFVTVQGQTNVGINNSAPALFTNPYDTLVIGNGDNATTGYGITIVTGGSATEGGIAFTDMTGGSRGRITYHQAHDKFLIGAGGNADQLQLLSSGNFGIGGAPTQKLSVYGNIRIHSGDLIIADSQVIKNTNDTLKLQPGSSRDILLLFGNGSTGVKLDRGGDLEVTNAVTASDALFGNLNISSDASVTGNMVVGGTLTAQEFRTEFNTEVVIETSGSTKFGNSPDDKHQFTGSLLIGSGSISGSHQSTGSFGKLFGDGSDLTGIPSYTVANSSNNRILTSVDSSNGNAEANLVFDGDHLGIGVTNPQLPLEVNLTNAEYAHFGSALTTDGHYAGISLGYHTAGNVFNRKTAIVQQQFSDGNRRGHLHFLVDTTADNFSTSISDSKMMIHGTTGFVGINKTATTFPYATTAPACALDVTGTIHATGDISGSATSTGSFGQVKTDAIIGTIGSNKQLAIQKGTYVNGNTAGAYFNLLATNTAYLSIVGDSDYWLHEWNNLSSTGKFVKGMVGGTQVFEIDGKGSVSGSSTSTGSFGRVSVATAKNGVNIGVIPSNWTSELNILGTQSTTGIKIQAPSSGDAQIKMYSNNGGSNNDFWYIQATNGGTFDIVNYGPGSFTNMVSIAGNTGHMTVRGNVSGSSTSTGSFGKGHFDGHVGIGTDKTNSDQYTVLHLDANGADNNLLVKQMFSINGTLQGSVFGFQNAIGFLDDDNNYAYRHITDSGHLWYSNNTLLMELKPSGGDMTSRLGINTDGNGPHGTLHVNSSNVSGVSYNASADNLIVEHNNDAGISILTPNNKIGAIYFGDPQDDNIGMLQYNHLANKMLFTAAASATPLFSLSANTAEFGSDIAKISGSSTSTGSFGKLLGDGSEITGISTTPFPFTGSAGISGSLSVDRQAANSGSTIVEVKGTQGTLFSVVDEMSGSIFSANTVAGIPVIEAFSDGTVHIGPNVTDGTFGKLFVNDNQVAVGGGTGFPFTGSAGLSGSLEVKHLQAATGSTLLSVQGSEGTLFSVVNSMTGSIFSANTTAGIPVIEAFSDGDVEFGPLTTKLSGSNSLTASFGMLNIGTENYKNNFSSSIAGRVAAVQAAGSGITISNNVNNRVLTGDGTNANAESSLTYDGSKLIVGTQAVDFTTSGDSFIINNDTNDVYLKLKGYGGNGTFTMDDAKAYFTNTNVGIGTASPVDKLHVVGNIRATGNIIAQNYIVSSSVTHMTQSFSSGSTIFGDTLKDTHQFTGSLNVKYSGSVGDNTAFSIEGNTGTLLNITDSQTGSLFNVNDVSGVPIFDVDSNDTITMGQFSSPIRVLTDSNGNTMISGSSTSTAKFGQYVEASSIAFKTNVETLENPLDKISKLRGVTYNLKSNNEPSIGMIAEEVNEVFPELVDKDDSGKPQAMSYTRMTAVLLEAVKELTEEVKELKKTNIYNKYKDKE